MRGLFTRSGRLVKGRACNRRLAGTMEIDTSLPASTSSDRPIESHPARDVLSLAFLSLLIELLVGYPQWLFRAPAIR